MEEVQSVRGQKTEQGKVNILVFHCPHCGRLESVTSEQASKGPINCRCGSPLRVSEGG